jgi:hypothetical protein
MLNMGYLRHSSQRIVIIAIPRESPLLSQESPTSAMQSAQPSDPGDLAFRSGQGVSALFRERSGDQCIHPAGKPNRVGPPVRTGISPLVC